MTNLKPNDEGPRLPPEVILHIISMMGAESMKKDLIGVNRFLTQEAERLSLYSDIRMTKPHSLHRFITAVKAHPQRATYVRTLELNLDASTAGVFAPALKLGRELVILQTFTNLRSLTIHHASNPASAQVLNTLTHCRLPHLTHFVSTWSLNDPSFRLFLARHPSLTSIGARKSYSLSFGLPTLFPPTLLPRLEELDGHWSNVVRLVKGRPVSRIAMRSANLGGAYVPNHKLSVVLPLLASSASDSGVQRLTVHVREANAEVVSLIARSLPWLGSLILVDASAAEDGAAEVDGELQAARTLSVAEALVQFENLREFGIDWNILAGNDLQHVETLGFAVPALRRIDIQGEKWVRNKSSDGWVMEQL